MQNAAYWMRWRCILLGVATLACPTLALATEAGPEGSEPPPKERKSESGNDSRRMDRAEDILALLREGNRMEIEGAKLALDKGQADRVKDYARLLTLEHQRCDKQLMDYANAKGVKQRSFEDGIQQPTDGPLDRLRVRQPQNFDRAFILAMVRQHGKMLDALKGTMQESHDVDLRRLLAGQMLVLERLKQSGETILARLPANSEN
jgi:predicted outer membrane protein